MANQYSIATIGGSAAHTATAPMHGQLHAVLKNSKSLKYCIPNEYICAELGRFLGLPIPPGGICVKKGHDPEVWYASLNFNLSATALPPVDPNICVTELPLESTGLILFDILIGNDDRHRNNLSLDLSNPSAKVLSVFDHSHAFFGPTNGKGIDRLARNKNLLSIGGHCLLKAIRKDDHFAEWIERIKALPNYLIDQVCNVTVPYGMITSAEAAAAKDFLKHRRTEIENIIKANKSEFAGISTWRLL